MANASFLLEVPWYRWDSRAVGDALSDAASESLRDRERQFALGMEGGVKASCADAIEATVASVGPDELALRMIVDGTSADALAMLEGVWVIGRTPPGFEIETVRCRTLTQLIEEMAETGVAYVEIAGNDQIMFTAIAGMSEQPKSVYSATRQGFDDYRHLMPTTGWLLVLLGALYRTMKRLPPSSSSQLTTFWRGCRGTWRS